MSLSDFFKNKFSEKENKTSIEQLEVPDLAKEDGFFVPHVPPQLESDFDRVLATDFRHVNFTFERYPDWYNKAKTPEIFRGQVTPINWKSKYSGSDTSSNFRVSRSTEIQKGDIIKKVKNLDHDDKYYIVIWQVENEINNKKTQIQDCNAFITFENDPEADIDPDTWQEIYVPDNSIVAKDMPCIIYEIPLKYNYGITMNSPGIAQSVPLQIITQYNNKTKDIKIETKLTWHGRIFKVISLSYGEVDVDGDSGLLSMYATPSVDE